jgi:putative solute:sodium symporter small subunit
MFEVLFGLVLAGLAAAVAAGLVPPSFQIEGFRPALAVAIGCSGVLLVMHGSFRMVRDGRAGNTIWFRTIGLMAATLFGLLAVIVMTTGRIGAASWSGWPAGYLLVAQGTLSVVLILMIAFQRQQRFIDNESSNAGRTGKEP